MAIGSEGELREKTGRKVVRRPVSVRYSHQGEPAAIGFETRCRWVRAHRRPGQVRHDDPHVVRSIRGMAHGCVQADGAGGRASRRDSQRVPADLAGRGLPARARVLRPQRRRDGRCSGQALANGHWADSMGEFLAAAYRSEEGELDEDRLLAALRELVADPMVRDGHRRARATARRARPRLPRPGSARPRLGRHSGQRGDDCRPGMRSGRARERSGRRLELDQSSRRFKIFVTETSIGGLGLLEALHRDYALDPRIFWDAVGRACAADRGRRRRRGDAGTHRRPGSAPTPSFGPAVRQFP